MPASELVFEPNARVELLEEALACWRGSAFEEFAEHDWAQLEAMRLDDLHILAQEELLEARLALGAHAALVGDLEALVTQYPLRERFWHQLIVALYRSGRAGEALRRAETLRVVLREELGLDPSPSLRELEARVLNDDPTLLQPPVAARRSVTRQLPAEPTRLVGRAEELGLLAGRLRTKSAGHSDGPGWSRQDADCHASRPRVVGRVRRRSVRDRAGAGERATSTVAAIATALDVQQRQHLSIEETLVEYLRARRALLVLDNCEHLRGTIASLSERLLSWCPSVTILATSREVLGLPGEQVWRVRPLAIPGEGSGPAVAAEAPATRLFVERAIAARPGFALGPDNVKTSSRSSVASTAYRWRSNSRRLAYGPWVRRHWRNVSAKGFDLLAGAQRSMIPRHRTVQDLVEWSYDLLGPDEQTCSPACACSPEASGSTPSKGCAPDGTWTNPERPMFSRTWWTSRWCNSSTRTFPAIGCWRPCANTAATGWARPNVSVVRSRQQPGTSKWPNDALDRWPDRMKRAAIRMLDRDFDNLRAAHRWSIEHSDIDTALRLVAGLREYSFRCMHAEIASWADTAIALPDACRA